MKIILCSTVLLSLFIGGCECTGPAISKSNVGNLQINVYGPEQSVPRAELYLDGIFIGNSTMHMPVLQVKRGQRVIRVEAPGFKPYEKTIVVLGEPNHQVLNVFLEPQ
jgi:hypothetical protein